MGSIGGGDMALAKRGVELGWTEFQGGVATGEAAADRMSSARGSFRVVRNQNRTGELLSADPRGPD